MPTIRIKAPFIGVNKNKDPSELTPQEAEDAQNLDLDRGTQKKRSGWTQQYDFTLDGAILGQYEYKKNDGTLIRIVKAGAKLKAINGGTVEILTGMSGTELASFATVNNRVFFCDSTLLKVTDGATVFNAQLAQAAVPTVAASGAVGAGNLKGTYDYKIALRSSTWGQEGPSSAASATVLLDNQNVSVTGLQDVTLLGDARLTGKRLYRRKVSANESVWRLVKTINATDTIDTDATRDNDLSNTTIAPLTYTDSLPSFRFMAYQAGVLLLSGADSNPTSVYFTRADQPWTVDDFIDVGSGGDTDRVTGLWPFQGLTVITKERSVWTLSGNSRSTFFLRKVWSGVGCAGHFSIIEKDGLLYWLGERGFYVFDGNEPVEISEPIRPDLIARNYAYDRYVVGVHDHANGYMYWSYAGPASMTLNKGYTFFYRNAKNVGAASWMPWVFTGNAGGLNEVTSLGLFSDATTKTRETYLGFRSGRVGKYTGNTDNASAIEAKWRTGKLDGGVEEYRKRWGEITVEATKQASSSVVAVRRYLDEDAAPTLIANHDHNDPIFRNRVSRSSRDIRLELYSNTTTPSEVTGMTLMAEKAGRA